MYNCKTRLENTNRESEIEKQSERDRGETDLKKNCKVNTRKHVNEEETECFVLCLDEIFMCNPNCSI